MFKQVLIAISLVALNVNAQGLNCQAECAGYENAAECLSDCNQYVAKLSAANTVARPATAQVIKNSLASSAAEVMSSQKDAMSSLLADQSSLSEINEDAVNRKSKTDDNETYTSQSLYTSATSSYASTSYRSTTAKSQTYSRTGEMNTSGGSNSYSSKSSVQPRIFSESAGSTKAIGSQTTKAVGVILAVSLVGLFI
ncbi:hypothetical protein AX774_g1592 [Zancudomyces culisetae]|uniref:Uncharacterized protein n=1 Tax=Zancudomyces culisetae TaxID=1213189 RepID=A0A1R1PVA0_ZANCU|nr:hypothetical protein AX774_g1592 [Zancudomyces culisetae]|eukprot:OMH84859.1 hypothetical protein AX774_g1592 [Zancudomyces culisetae]